MTFENNIAWKYHSTQNSILATSSVTAVVVVVVSSSSSSSILDAGTHFPGNEKLGLHYAITKSTKQAGMNLTLPPPSQKCHLVRWHLYHWIKMDSRWNKKLISLSSPDWSASLRPSLEARPDALIGPNDSTATGWKMWCALMFEYFADLWMAAFSAAEPASRAAAIYTTYESANGQMTVTSQVSGFQASQETSERPSGRFSSDRLRPLQVALWCMKC